MLFLTLGDEGEMFKVVEYPIYKFLEKIGQLQVLTVTEATTFAEVFPPPSRRSIERYVMIVYGPFFLASETL